MWIMCAVWLYVLSVNNEIINKMVWGVRGTRFVIRVSIGEAESGLNLVKLYLIERARWERPFKYYRARQRSSDNR